MKLHPRELRMMNRAPRRFVMKHLEYKTFEKFGLDGEGKHILEIGCGSGYGAQLLSESVPRSYVGIDLMPEQIELAKKRRLKNAEFLLMDASNLSYFPDGSKDMIVIFGILHHVPAWRDVVRENYRVLKPGGDVFVQEPSRLFLKFWDFFFRWHHPKEALFTLTEFEEHFRKTGFWMINRTNYCGLGIYRFQKPLCHDLGRK